MNFAMGRVVKLFLRYRAWYGYGALLAGGALLRAAALPAAPASPPAAVPALAANSTVTAATLFAQGEHLTYTLYWGPVAVGHVDWFTWLAQRADGTPLVRSIVAVHTDASVDDVYRVRGFTRSWASLALDHSLQYSTEQQERAFSRSIGLLFDPLHHTIRTRPFITALTPPPATAGSPAPDAAASTPDPKKPAPVAWTATAPTLDPLAALVSYRLLPLRAGLEQRVSVCDGSDVRLVTVRVLRQETITVNDQPVRTWVVEPDLPGGGLFARSDGQPLRMWISADAARRPVRFTGHVGIGDFEADLTGVSPYAPPPAPAQTPAPALAAK
jgi:hypothetical protein